jgi:hypothetical protein
MLLAEKRHTFCWFQGAILNRANMSRQLVSTRLQENCCLTSNFAQRYVLGEYELYTCPFHSYCDDLAASLSALIRGRR